ncbi:hypothetical protein K503DRAFT_775513, partial [Rhizopogon vinicolor AM-OR11-026]
MTLPPERWMSMGKYTHWVLLVQGIFVLRVFRYHHLNVPDLDAIVEHGAKIHKRIM